MAGKPTYEELESRINALQSDVAGLEQSLTKLSEKERYYRLLLANLHDDILVIDRQYRITDANKAFLDTSGRSRKEVIGRYCYEISHGYREPCSKYGEACMLQEVFETGRPATCLHKHVHADGSKILCDLILSPRSYGTSPILLMPKRNSAQTRPNIVFYLKQWLRGL